MRTPFDVRSAVNRIRRRSSFIARRLSPGVRRLPDFLIIGAMRGGTTSLYSYLIAQPGVVAALDKEAHFFDLNYSRGESWYRTHFSRAEEPAGRITGEATPYYMFHPLVPERVKATVPSVKLIALLRDPVERAYSHYKHSVLLGLETLSFEDALEAEDQRLAGEEARLVTSGAAAKSFAHQHHSYVARGRYAEQLERWLSCFPRNQILILKSEELRDDTASVIQRVGEFLGVPILTSGHYAELNVIAGRAMKPETRAWLEDYFRSHNERLSTLLGPEFIW